MSAQGVRARPLPPRVAVKLEVVRDDASSDEDQRMTVPMPRSPGSLARAKFRRFDQIEFVREPEAERPASCEGRLARRSDRWVTRALVALCALALAVTAASMFWRS